jgi:hypothetical protein
MYTSFESKEIIVFLGLFISNKKTVNSIFGGFSDSDVRFFLHPLINAERVLEKPFDRQISLCEQFDNFDILLMNTKGIPLSIMVFMCGRHYLISHSKVTSELVNPLGAQVINGLSRCQGFI